MHDYPLHPLILIVSGDIKHTIARSVVCLFSECKCIFGFSTKQVNADSGSGMSCTNWRSSRWDPRGARLHCGPDSLPSPQNSGAVAGLTTGSAPQDIANYIIYSTTYFSQTLNSYIQGTCVRHFNFNSSPFNVNLNFCACSRISLKYLVISLRFNCLGILCIKFCTLARCCLDIIPLNFHARAHSFIIQVCEELP